MLLKHTQGPYWYHLLLLCQEMLSELPSRSEATVRKLHPIQEMLHQAGGPCTGAGIVTSLVTYLQMPPAGLPNLPGLLAAQTGAGARPPGSAT